MNTTTHNAHSAQQTKKIDPIQAVCFSLVGAFLTVVAITAIDKVAGESRYSMSGEQNVIERTGPRP